MKIDIKPKSKQNPSGKWMPVANVYIHEGFQVRHLDYKWANKEFETKEAADFHANYLSKRFLIHNGLWQ